VILASPLARALRAHRLASRYKAPSDFVFGNRRGSGLNYRYSAKASGRRSRALDCKHRGS
jgi:hypothetical protein